MKQFSRKVLSVAVGLPLLLCLFSSCALMHREYRWLVKQGAADLRSIQFDDSMVVRLNGDWHLWQGELLSPAEVRERLVAGQGGVISVPGYWSAVGPFEDTSALCTTGTLAVVLDLPLIQGNWAVRLPDANSACALYANGMPIASIGRVSGDSDSFLPGRGVETASFAAYDGKAILVLQVANFSLPQTGTWDSPLFGTERAIESKRARDSVLIALISGAMLFMGLYHFALWILRRNDWSSLVFSAICALMSVRNLIMGERILVSLFPATASGWRSSFCVELLSVHLCVGLFYLFFRLIFPDEMKKGPVTVAVAACVLWMSVVLLFPPVIAFRFLPWFECFIGAACLWILAVNVLAVVRGREGSAIILVGSAILILTAVNDILFSNGVIQSLYLTTFGMFVFTFSQSFFLSRRSANLFTSVERYAGDLKLLNASLERFIPKEMLEYLGKRSIVDVRFGDYIEATMTVFFLDIRDFTARSELMTPEATFNFINRFLERFGPVVREHGGFIDKYLGDGFMALFPCDPDEAVLAALDMRAGLADFDAELTRAGQSPLRFGVGIHTGPLMLGTIGENLRMDTTVISDTVNTASRLEQLNKRFGTDILISGETFAALKSQSRFSILRLSEETVKGKSKSIQVYEISSLDRVPSR